MAAREVRFREIDSDGPVRLTYRKQRGDSLSALRKEGRLGTADGRHASACPSPPLRGRRLFPIFGPSQFPARIPLPRARALRLDTSAMCNEEILLVQYGRLQAWVERERARLKDAGPRPDQAFLRRARICADIERTDFVELVRELAYFT